MSKKLKELIEFIKVHRKESIGVAIALGIAIIGVGGYAINSHYSKNNIALAEKKDDVIKVDENTELCKENQEETTTESDVVVEEKEDGTLIVKDKEGNTIADSSKGDDVTKVIAEKKEAGSNVAIKDKDGKVENGSITITNGGTVTVKPPVAENTKPSEPSKPSESKPNNSIGGNAESNSKPQTNNESSNNPAPPVENKPVNKPNNDSSNNNKPQDKPVEQIPTPKPPTENKPVEKPQEPVKPQRTWEYQAGMSSELLNLINDYRTSQGLHALAYSNKLAGDVKQHCEEMVQNGTSFHKTYPNSFAQNVFSGNTVSSASGILGKWKSSSGHNMALLDEDITEGVCSVYRDSDGDYYAVFDGTF